MRVLLFVLLLLAYVATKKATIRVRLNDEGIHFFSDVGHHILDYEIKKIDFPQISIPITGGPGTGIVNVTNLRIQQFTSPDIIFKLAPPNGIGWKTKGGSIKVVGDWQAQYTVVIPISISGYVKASAVDIRMVLQADIDVDDLRPQLNVDACSMDVQSVDVVLGGGVLPWIVNLFRAELSALIKEEIRTQLCVTLETVLLEKANMALLSLPTHLQLADNFYINYRCEERPVATTSFIEGEIYTNVVYGNVTCDLRVDEMDHDVERAPYMAHFWISEHIPNCLLLSAHSSDLLTFVVDKDFNGGQFKSFLRTSCSLLSLCIGRFFPILREQYPDQFVDFRFHAAQSPWITVQPEGVKADALFYIDLFISPWIKQKDHLARLAANATLDMMPSFVNRTLSGSIDNVTVTIAEVDSHIGHFNERIIAILDALVRETVEVVAGSVLRVGVPVPLVDNVTLSNNASIVTKRGFVRISSDFIYE